MLSERAINTTVLPVQLCKEEAASPAGEGGSRRPRGCRQLCVLGLWGDPPHAWAGDGMLGQSSAALHQTGFSLGVSRKQGVGRTWQDAGQGE